MKQYFITGTDTECGKTYVTCQFLEHFNRQNQGALAVKPVVTGAVERDGEWIYEDIIELQKFNQVQKESITRWAFRPPMSPHLASQRDGVKLSVREIWDFCDSIRPVSTGHLFIEGAGGLMAPLNEQETWVDFLKWSQIPVILVVGLRLGCLNHALLTDSVLKANNIYCQGWIANVLNPNLLGLEENIETLRRKMSTPMFARVNYGSGLELTRYSET